MVALGVMIPFKIVNFPDLTAEGAYPLGGALCASLILAGIHPLLATLIATLAGGLLGIGTAFIHLRFKVNTLLAGIILSTMVYSINLRIMQKPNLALFDKATLFSGLFEPFDFKFVLLMIINVAIFFLFYRFLICEKGLRLRAIGHNPLFAQRQGIALSHYVMFGLFIGNALNSLAGSLIVQIQQYADIGMGVGIVIHALAALMIGESIVGTHTLKRQLLAPFVGALIYQQIQGLAMTLGLAPSDLKLMTGTIVLIAISYKLKGAKVIQ
jgi:putative ABC transport system permease protein